MEFKTGDIPMPEGIGTIYDQMKSAIMEAAIEESEIILRAGRCVAIAEAHIEKLKEYVRSNPFKGQPEEIFFFKFIKPRFYSFLIYYTHVYQIELHLPQTGKERVKNYYEAELLGLELQFKNNISFYEYYRSGDNSLDERYFIRDIQTSTVKLHPLNIDTDRSFSTGYDFKVAQLLAQSALSNYIGGKILEAAGTAFNAQHFTQTNKERILWNAKLIYVAELIYALYAFAPFEGKVSLKKICDVVCDCFGITIDNIYKKCEEIRLRKKNQTIFLDLLLSALIRQMEEDDRYAA